MLNWLKWKIASKEMAELERWHIQWDQHRRWLAEFPNVVAALDNLKEEAAARDPLPIGILRDRMRRGVFAAQRAQAQEET